MSWLAWQLRKIDKKQEIEEWVGSITLQSDLLMKLSNTLQPSEDMRALSNVWSVSRPFLMNVDGEMISQVQSRSETLVSTDTPEDHTNLLKPELAVSVLQKSVIGLSDKLQTKNIEHNQKLHQVEDQVSNLGMNVKELLERHERTVADRYNGESITPTVKDSSVCTDPALSGLDMRKARLKLKRWWRDALWRLLDKKGKKLCYGLAVDNLEQLLEEMTCDEELKAHLLDMFPEEDYSKLGCLVLPTKELKEFLVQEMERYYRRY
jgi:hypothetical protein